MSGNASGGMIFLEPGNLIIEEIVTCKMQEGAKKEPVDVRLSDFDDVLYRLFVDKEEMGKFTVSVSLRCYDELYNNGVQTLLEEEYAGMVSAEPQAGYNLTLEFDVDNLPDSPDNMIKKISQLKRNLMGAPLNQAFSAMKRGETAGSPPVIIPSRPTENMYVVPDADRVTVIFAVDFVDETDKALAWIFLQEFQEARRKVQNAPPVTVSDAKNPPLELREIEEAKNADTGIVGYISFSIFTTHIEKDIDQERVVTLLQGFRNYLHYHIKASKSYMQSRMRTRVSMLLEILKDAKPQVERTKKKKVTAGGRPFN